jgi:hypothetical protein
MKYNEKNFKVMVVLAKLMKENPQIKLYYLIVFLVIFFEKY